MKNRLKELRIEKNFGQKEFYEKIVTEKLGINTTLRSYQNWEKEESNIKSLPAQKLADYFGVRLEYLIGNSSIRTKEEATMIVETQRVLQKSFEENPPKFEMVVTDPEEMDLLYNYKQLKKPYQKHVRDYARSVFELQKEVNKSTNSETK